LIEERLDNHGMTLAFGRWDGAGRPVVVLHGWLEQAPCWDRVASALKRPVYAPDHRGHGLSDWAAPTAHYPFWDYVADVDALVQHIGAPVDLVGHSMGGTMAALYAAVAPERVGRLVLIEGIGPPDEGITEAGVARARAFLNTRRDPPVHRPIPSVEEGALRIRRNNPEIPEDMAGWMARRTLRRTDAGWVWTWDPRHKTRMPQPFLAAQLRVHLRAIRAPTLLIFGENSPYLAMLPDRPDRESDIADHRTIVLPGVGHNPHHEAPNRLADAIAAHLEAP
jgi:pimeloyl-ACP methyl ester carboxylesterase